MLSLLFGSEVEDHKPCPVAGRGILVGKKKSPGFPGALGINVGFPKISDDKNHLGHLLSLGNVGSVELSWELTCCHLKKVAQVIFIIRQVWEALP